MAVGAVKSNTVPFTGSILPVGMSVASTGVIASALIVSTWSRIVPLPSPARLK